MGDLENTVIEYDQQLEDLEKEVDEKEFYDEEQLKSEIGAVEAHLSEAEDDIKSNETKAEVLASEYGEEVNKQTESEVEETSEANSTAGEEKASENAETSESKSSVDSKSNEEGESDSAKESEEASEKTSENVVVSEEISTSDSQSDKEAEEQSESISTEESTSASTASSDSASASTSISTEWSEYISESNTPGMLSLSEYASTSAVLSEAIPEETAEQLQAYAISMIKNYAMQNNMKYIGTDGSWNDNEITVILNKEGNNVKFRYYIDENNVVTVSQVVSERTVEIPINCNPHQDFETIMKAIADGNNPVPQGGDSGNRNVKLTYNNGKLVGVKTQNGYVTSWTEKTYTGEKGGKATVLVLDDNKNNELYISPDRTVILFAQVSKGSDGIISGYVGSRLEIDETPISIDTRGLRSLLSDSQSISNALESESISQSIVNSESEKRSVSDSQSQDSRISESEEKSKSNSTSQSIVESESQSRSKSDSQSQDSRISESEEKSKSNSTSQSIYESESKSESTSNSISHSIASESLSDSKSTSQELSEIESEIKSISGEIVSESESTSISRSESTSTSISNSESTSISTSASTSSSSTESETPVVPVVPLRPTNNDVPLSVIEEVETVDEEETPLAGLGDLGKRVWWAWIPGVSALVSSYDGYKKNKKKAEEKDTDEDNEEE